MTGIGEGALRMLAGSGAEDAVIPGGNLSLLEERWPGCQVVVVGGCGHALTAQVPEQLAGLISRFVAGRF